MFADNEKANMMKLDQYPNMMNLDINCSKSTHEKKMQNQS